MNATTWLRQNLFNGWFNSILTILILLLLAWVVPPAVRWVLLDSVWTAETSAACAGIEGACWAVVGEKYRLLLFSVYPYQLQWRPTLAISALVLAGLLSTRRELWNRWLLIIWIVALVAYFVLMRGGILGLRYVPATQWGGLALTIMLAIVACGVAFPMAILMALGRRSSLPLIRTLCVVFIELVRGVPLISILFMASFMLPLFLPTGVSVNQLLRAQIALILFVTAYLAEAIRGGLQAIPKGQYEAADAMGLTYWKRTILIILPQALRISIPPMVNTFIGVFKDTSLVAIIGLLDLLASARAAVADPSWRVYFIEVYVFVAAVYWVFCYFISKFSQSIERDLARGHKH